MNAWWLLAPVSLLVGVAFWAFDRPAWPQPKGPHRVGAILSSATSGQREIGLRIFYPAVPGAPREPLLPVMSGATSRAMGELYGLPLGEGDGEPSHTVENAALSTGGPLPVVVFSHGAFSFAEQNLSTMEALASHGFVVVAVAHSGEAAMTLLPEGRRVPLAPEFAGVMKKMSKTPSGVFDEYVTSLDKMRVAPDGKAWRTASAQLADVYQRMFPVPLEPLLAQRNNDLRSALAALRRMNEEEDHPFFARLDFRRVGLFGHSLGGHAVLHLLLDRDTEAKTAVVLDVPDFRTEIDEPELMDPVLFLSAEGTRLPGGRVARVAGVNQALPRAEEALLLEFELRGASHMNFADMNYLPRLVRWFGLLGSIEGKTASNAVNEMVVAHFQEELLGARGAREKILGKYPQFRAVLSGGASR